MSAVIDNILYVDLEEKEFRVEREPELFKRFLGGSGVAVELLYVNCPPKVDPLSCENPIILATGAFGGVYPSAGKTIAAFKSPLTNDLGESHAGGRLATSLRLAGYGAVVLEKGAPGLSFIEITRDEVSFADASPLKGATSLEVERRVRGCEEVARMQSVLSIGPAGENLVSYSCVTVDRYNYFGRLGLGAVMGAKGVKAISVVGDGQIKLPDPERFIDVFDEIFEAEIQTELMAKYHFTGTPANVLPLNELKALPTRNFLQGQFEYAEEISGENLGERWLERKVSCPMCPIGCMHVSKLRFPFATGYEFAPRDVYYNYESIYALGSNLGVETAEGVLQLIFRANQLGVDTMLMGNALGWATEAFERKAIDSGQTGGLTPSWGDVDTYLEMMDRICGKENEFYSLLAQGLEPAASRYGGESYSMTLNGNGLAGYHTGYAFVVGTIVGSRHSHNNNAGYSIDQKELHLEIDPEKIISYLIDEHEWRNVLTSLGVCLFARSIYTKRRILEGLKAIGIERTGEELDKIGRKILDRAFEFKFREGFDFGEVKIPERLFESPTANGLLDEKVLRDMLQAYVDRRFPSVPG